MLQRILFYEHSLGNCVFFQNFWYIAFSKHRFVRPYAGPDFFEGYRDIALDQFGKKREKIHEQTAPHRDKK